MKINRRLAGSAALPVVATLLLAGCGSSDAAPSTETRSADQSWSYTTGYGNTITLDHAPERIVVDAYSAAALWDLRHSAGRHLRLRRRQSRRHRSR